MRRSAGRAPGIGAGAERRLLDAAAFDAIGDRRDRQVEEVSPSSTVASDGRPVTPFVDSAGAV